jgi:transposase
VITIGIDPHSRTHVAAALDERGGVLAELAVGSNPRELDRLARWVAGMGPDRIVAFEGARGFGLALARLLLAAGETVLDVAPSLTASERRPCEARARTTAVTPWRWRGWPCANLTTRASPRRRPEGT